MSAGSNIWDMLTRAAMFLFFVAFVILIGIWYHPLIDYNARMRRHSLDLQNRIQQAQQEGRQLKISEEALRDPRTIERLVRERLGYARTGETVIRFEAPGAVGGTPVSPRPGTLPY